MKKVLFKAVAIVGLTCCLAACEDMRGRDIGTLAGAGVGAAAGAAIGGSGTGAVLGATGGAVVGGVAGHYVGKSMEKGGKHHKN